LSGVALPTKTDQADRAAFDAMRIGRKLWRATRWSAVTAARLAWFLAAAPFRLVAGVRRVMTPASTTLLVIGIVGLNIIWGYPWLGIFSVCVSMLGLGFLVSRVFRPRLRLGAAVPLHAQAGVPFSVQIYVRNAGRLPGLETFIRFAARNAVSFRETQPVHFIDYLRPSGRTRLSTTAVIERRGVHVLPEMIVECLFPFHLFRSTRRVPSDAQIAITPRPLDPSDNLSTQNLALSIVGFAKKQMSGESMEYTGSREYQSGMSVRRWDFASWARLGQPIVREFSSPAIQSVVIVVDTAAVAQAPQRRSRQRDKEAADRKILERILSTATTAISELTKCNVRVTMVLTSEPDAAEQVTGIACTPKLASDLLIRLAAAEFVDTATADDRMNTRLGAQGNTPVLVLSGRAQMDLHHTLGQRSTWIRIDAPSDGGAGPTPRPPAAPNTNDRKHPGSGSQSLTRANAQVQR